MGSSYGSFFGGGWVNQRPLGGEKKSPNSSNIIENPGNFEIISTKRDYFHHNYYFNSGNNPIFVPKSCKQLGAKKTIEVLVVNLQYQTILNIETGAITAGHPPKGRSVPTQPTRQDGKGFFHVNIPRFSCSRYGMILARPQNWSAKRCGVQQFTVILSHIIMY